MPALVPQLIRLTLALIGGATIVHWVVKEVRRVNQELDRVRTPPTGDAVSTHDMPTLRRDPRSGEWRPV